MGKKKVVPFATFEEAVAKLSRLSALVTVYNLPDTPPIEMVFEAYKEARISIGSACGLLNMHIVEFRRAYQEWEGE